MSRRRAVASKRVISGSRPNSKGKSVYGYRGGIRL